MRDRNSVTSKLKQAESWGRSQGSRPLWQALRDCRSRVQCDDPGNYQREEQALRSRKAGYQARTDWAKDVLGAALSHLPLDASDHTTARESLGKTNRRSCARSAQRTQVHECTTRQASSLGQPLKYSSALAKYNLQEYPRKVLLTI